MQTAIAQMLVFEIGLALSEADAVYDAGRVAIDHQGYLVSKTKFGPACFYEKSF
jgi:hypothetical protein